MTGSGGSEDERNQVSFRMERSREAGNDWGSPVIGVTHEDSGPARLTDRTNVDTSRALAVARARQGIRVHSEGQRTVRVETQPRHAFKLLKT